MTELLMIFLTLFGIPFLGMAKIKLSAVVSEARGKLNGSVFSRNRGGAYLRNKVTPNNPQSDNQLNQRRQVTELSQKFRGLTAEQRRQWNSIVSEFASADIFGDQKEPSGINLFSRLNRYRMLMDEPIIDEPPMPPEVPGLETLDVTLEDDGTFTIGFTPDPAPEGVKLFVWATPQVSAGQENLSNKLRLIKVADAESASPLDIAADWAERFGFQPVEGAKVMVRVQAVHVESGVPGSIIQSTNVVEEAAA